MTVALTLIASGCGGSSHSHATSDAATSDAANRFLSRYVTGDGRVIRHDQGGDIVGEGQAYGMLIAEIAGRPALVRTIWAWASTHLRRADGLLEFHASGSGQIEDNQSAADADVLAAYALLRYRGAGEGAMHEQGRRLAAAILEHETATVNAAPVLLAGEWAATTSPPTVNPSYLSPGVSSALARLTGDQRWQRAAEIDTELVSQLTGGGRSLPTDWAQLSNGRLLPVGAPDGSAPTRYGLDAARLPIWFGTACSAQARALAARWWGILRRDDRSSQIALTPAGSSLTGGRHPVPLLAGAAAAQAAGDAAASRSLRAQAHRQSQQAPTYYGDAWLAMGDALLTGSLNPCDKANDG